MNRTTQRGAPINAPGVGVSLDAMPCYGCGAVPPVVISTGTTDAGAVEFHFCGMVHAIQAGAFSWMRRQAERERRAK